MSDLTPALHRQAWQGYPWKQVRFMHPLPATIPTVVISPRPQAVTAREGSGRLRTAWRWLTAPLAKGA